MEAVALVGRLAVLVLILELALVSREDHGGPLVPE
jgi:hypothetical protein